MYCVKCRKSVEVDKATMVTMNTGKGVRYAMKGSCPSCGTNVRRFIKKP
jgi:hypothetical protein